MIVELHEAKTGRRIAFRSEDIIRVYEYSHKSLPDCSSYVVVAQPDIVNKVVAGEFRQMYKNTTYLYLTETYDKVIELLRM